MKVLIYILCHVDLSYLVIQFRIIKALLPIIQARFGICIQLVYSISLCNSRRFKLFQMIVSNCLTIKFEFSVTDLLNNSVSSRNILLYSCSRGFVSRNQIISTRSAFELHCNSLKRILVFRAGVSGARGGIPANQYCVLYHKI